MKANQFLYLLMGSYLSNYDFQSTYSRDSGLKKAKKTKKIKKSRIRSKIQKISRRINRNK
jgi:hypothetical protein